MNKTWIMHYTVWLGAAILDPLRILIQPDVKFEGYVAGMDDTMIRQERWMPSNIEFSTLGSAFVFACGATFSSLAARQNSPVRSSHRIRECDAQHSMGGPPACSVRIAEVRSA